MTTYLPCCGTCYRFIQNLLFDFLLDVSLNNTGGSITVSHCPDSCAFDKTTLSGDHWLRANTKKYTSTRGAEVHTAASQILATQTPPTSATDSKRNSTHPEIRGPTRLPNEEQSTTHPPPPYRRHGTGICQTTQSPDLLRRRPTRFVPPPLLANANTPQIPTDTATDLQPLAPPYYSRTGTKTSTSPGSKKPVVVIVHQPSGPVKEPGSERPGYGGYYH